MEDDNSNDNSGPQPHSQTLKDQSGNKRRRISLACGLCRAKKSRCDGTRPRCSACVELNCDCVYAQATSSSHVLAEKAYLGALEDRLKHAEDSIRVLQTHQSRCHKQLRFEDGTNGGSPEPSHLNVPATDAGPDETQVNTVDHHEQSGPENDADGMGAMIFSSEEDCGFYGPTSNIAFTRHISRAVAHLSHFKYSPFMSDNPDSQSLRFHSGVMNVSQPPSPRSAPMKVRPYGTEKVNIYALPPENKTRAIVSDYFRTTGYLFPYIHEPKFWATYEEMKTNKFTKIRRTWLGLLNIIMALTTSVSVEPGVSAEQRIRESYIFYQRSAGLCDPQIMRGSSLELVQYLLVAGQYLQGTQRSVETWTIHGLAVKVAYQLGLHSPDASLRFTPLEREIRKRTWYGCVMLDRTLSMTFGRPATIPEDYVRMELPCHFPNGSSSLDIQDPREESSLDFFNATTNLYKIMWTIINVEYDANIGVTSTKSIFDTVSGPFQLEQSLLTWERQLPGHLTLFRSINEFPPAVDTHSTSNLTARFRVILTLRYLNLKILLHRPVLVKILEKTGAIPEELVDDPDLKMLQQMGGNSIQSCVKSAMDIITIVRTVASFQDQRRKWLGAWWFSLYYTFNAALIICAALLSSHGQCITESNFGVPQIELERSLFDAVDALRQLNSKNRMVERCAIHLTQLIGVLESLGVHFTPGMPMDGTHPSNAAMSYRQASFSLDNTASADDVFGAYSSDLMGHGQPLGLDLGEFMLGGDVDFLNQVTRMG